MLSGIEGIQDLCLTTNGSLLADKAASLREAGLNRVTVSIDSLNPQTFARMAQRGSLESVLEGVAAASRAGLSPIKVNAVLERGVNDHEIAELLAYARSHGYEMRFIEFMDVGNVNGWSSSKLVDKDEILRRVAAVHPFRRPDLRAGQRPLGALQVPGRAGKLRSHRIGHRAVLRRLHQGQADGGRQTRDLPVLHGRPRHQVIAQVRRVRRGHPADHSRSLERPVRPVLRGETGGDLLRGRVPPGFGPEDRDDQPGRIAGRRGHGRCSRSGLQTLVASGSVSGVHVAAEARVHGALVEV